MLAAVACVWAASCAQPQPVDADPAPQPAVGASDGGGMVDGEGASERAEPEVALVDGDGEGVSEGAEPDGGVVDSQGVSEGAQSPDGASVGGGVVDGEGVLEGVDSEGALVDDGGIVDREEVSEGASEPEGSGRFRQPGELVGHPLRLGAVVGEGAGPLRSEHSLWEAVMGEVFEACDGGAAVIDALLDSGVYLTAAAAFDITYEFGKLQRGSCIPGEPGYVHIGWRGPAGAVRASPEEAIEAVQNAACLYGCGHNLGGYGSRLGYEVRRDVFRGGCAC